MSNNSQPTHENSVSKSVILSFANNMKIKIRIRDSTIVIRNSQIIVSGNEKISLSKIIIDEGYEGSLRITFHESGLVLSLPLDQIGLENPKISAVQTGHNLAYLINCLLDNNFKLTIRKIIFFKFYSLVLPEDPKRPSLVTKIRLNK